jgi:hypothetical protein
MTPTLDLDTLHLESGGHAASLNQFSVLEAVAFIAGEPWSDHPQCASPIVGAFLRSWNDSSGDVQRQELKRYIPRLVNSRGTNKQEEERAWMALDWLVRVNAPTWLRLAGLTVQADILASLKPLDADSYPSILPALKAVRSAARAAARDAARDAAWDAAWAAAWDAARAAGGAALAPTVTELSVSAHDLVDRMLAVTEAER